MGVGRPSLRITIPLCVRINTDILYPAARYYTQGKKPQGIGRLSGNLFNRQNTRG